jgi:pyruvate formate lyase activating enzyme
MKELFIRFGEFMSKAMFFEKLESNVVKCNICPHTCVLKEGQTGICLARKNINGNIYSLNYGKITACALDPIEKKPLNRFFSGSNILSIGSFGCNLKCSFCQNWNISQEEAQSEESTPKQIIEIALGAMKDGNIGVAYTYNEPLIGYEFVYDCCVLAHENGLKNVVVTNGYVNKEPMVKLLPFIDAMNIDLKSFNDEFYHNTCKGKVEYVKETIQLCAKACHVEVTTLLIPGENDSETEIDTIARWLASVSPIIPLHLNRYHPDYKMTEPPIMPKERLYQLAEIAQKHLKYVYCGN